MHIPWEDMQLFLAIAEGKSLTGAAKRLRITQPTASRRLAQLEAQLGEPLFVRSVEGTALTTVGERLLEPARRMAEWAGEVERAAEAEDRAPRGLVRVTAPPGVAYELLAPFAAWLRERLPEVRLEVVASVLNLDLARREADLAIRIGRVPADLVTLASRTSGVGVFLARSLARTLPKRPKPADVPWIGWAPPLDQLPPNPELAALIPGWAPSFTCDDYVVMLRAAEAGAGALFLARLHHRFGTATKRLVEIDVGLPRVEREVRLVCAKSALDIPRVRAVAELLEQVIREAEEPPALPRR
jgi:DNA-binding transcriptional LysR family regulator